MANSGDDNNMVIFRTKSWKVIDSINLSSKAVDIKFTSDDKNIVFATDSLHIYNLDSGKVIRTFRKTPYDSLITNDTYTRLGEFDLSPDGKNIVYVCAIVNKKYPYNVISVTTVIYNIEADTIIKQLTTGGRNLVYSPDGQYLISCNGGNTGYAFLTELSTGEKIKTWEFMNTEGIAKYRFTRDSKVYIYSIN